MHDLACHGDVNCVRSKDAQKQLARMSLTSNLNETWMGSLVVYFLEFLYAILTRSQIH